MRCASIRKKGAAEQCEASALSGFDVCGRHARCKVVVRWVDAQQKRHPKLVKLQAWVRGSLVRRRLEMAGPGVLRRKGLANDEDLETCEERVHPFSYFSFEENGKIWWFHFNTLWKWSLQNREPSNPYTKVPLTTETRKRLREVWTYKRRRKENIPAEARMYSERHRNHWNLLCQVFADNGFGSLSPDLFANLSCHDFDAIFHMIRDDVQTVYPEASWVRAKTVGYCARMRTLFLTRSNLFQYWSSSSYALILMATMHKNPYNLVFIILSALYRV